MKKIKLTVKILTTVVVSGMGFASNSFCNEYKTKQKKVMETSDFMLTNKDKTSILKLPLTENPIPVILENFNEEQKQCAIEAITRLDNISKNLNYVVLDSDDYNITQKITLSLDKDLMECKKAPGIAVFSHNQHSGEIHYPINITLDPDCINIVSSETGENMFTSVIKHEMLHTLGFSDNYSYSDKNKTIMYYSMDSDNRALDYTEYDEYNIRKIYDNFVDEVEKPTQIQVTNCYHTKEEQQEM